MASEGETSAGIQKMVGIYNVVWAGTGALADFTGGMMLDKLGLRSIFYVPAAIMFGQVVITFWLARRVRSCSVPESLVGERVGPPHPNPLPEERENQSALATTELNPRPISRAQWFLRMAWLANAFAYIALNTVIAVVPDVANKLGLSATLAGFCCSVWWLARFAAFFGLWAWSGWHYRFRWLLTAYLALLAVFAFAQESLVEAAKHLA